MLIRYKLTDQSMQTHGGFQIPESGWYKANQVSTPRPCSNTVLHHYATPLLALLLNPIHANITNPRLFQIGINKELGTDGLKGWCREQKVIKELELPEITLVNRVAFGIYCAYPTASESWKMWADAWLAGTDRTEKSAWAAARAAGAWVAAEAGAWAARVAGAAEVRAGMAAEAGARASKLLKSASLAAMKII